MGVKQRGGVLRGGLGFQRVLVESASLTEMGQQKRPLWRYRLHRGRVEFERGRWG